MSSSDGPGDDDTRKEPGRSTTNVHIDQQGSEPGLLIRALWFLFIGWWLTGWWLLIAWVLNLTIIGIPLGFKMINLVPKVLTLKQRRLDTAIRADAGGDLSIIQSGRAQRSLIVRALWFVFVGWWASLIWMFGAWILSITIIGLPIAIWMYHKLPFVVSLYRY